MANLHNIVYLSEEQKATLFSTGSVTANVNNTNITVNYNPDDLYITPQTIETNAPSSGSSDLITSGAVYAAIPHQAANNSTGISIADHSTTSITGVSGSTTASIVTVGSHNTDYGVKSAGSGSFTQGSFSGGSFSQGTDSFTANTPTIIDTSKFNGGAFTRGAFTGGVLEMNIARDDSSLLLITFTPATHGADSFTAASLSNGFYTAGTAAIFHQGMDSFTAATHGADTHTHTAPTLGSKIPTISTGNVTVPIATNAITVVTGATHTITDNGHTHNLG